MKALFIGRFQPFHNGHLEIIKIISNEFDKLAIGIGSSQYHDTHENPFSFEERKRMISQSLDSAGISNYHIVAIPDIHNPPKWVSHVVSIVPDFDVIVSNNPLTLHLFKERGYKTRVTPPYKKLVYSGKEIRRRIIENEPWKNLVPTAVYTSIVENKGVQRIQHLDE